MYIPDINKTLEEAQSSTCTHINKRFTTGSSVSDPAWVDMCYCQDCDAIWGWEYEGKI